MPLQTVLLAVGANDADRTDRLARIAVDVAGPSDATVTLAHVFTEEGYRDARDRLEFDAEGVTPDAVAGRHATVRALAGALSEAGVEHAVRGRVGREETPGDRVVELAREVDADLAIVGGRGRSPAGKAVFGSTAQTVLLNAPCPVTFVRGG